MSNINQMYLSKVGCIRQLFHEQMISLYSLFYTELNSAEKMSGIFLMLLSFHSFVPKLRLCFYSSVDFFS